MANYNFNKDIIIGEDGEKIVTDWLCKNTNGNLVSDNKTNSHDVIIQFPNRLNSIWSGKVSLEIKTDVFVTKFADTGNMFIEFESRNKLSGISVCKADYFVTYFKYLNELWVINTQELRDLIVVNPFRVFKNAGDAGSNTHGYLIPRMKFRQYFKRYKLI